MYFKNATCLTLLNFDNHLANGHHHFCGNKTLFLFTYLMVMGFGKGRSSSPSLGVNGDWIKPNWTHLTPSVHPKRRPVLGVHWKYWCWSWNSNTLATSCKELTHWKRPWCWEGLEAGGKGDDRGWDGWMASPTRCTWFWVNSGSWWWTGRLGMLRFMGSQRVGHDWATELNWKEHFFRD